MPDRSIMSSDFYQQGYQGQPVDEETGFNSFELRLYDARIGGWLSPDPYKQHISPYMAMSNNPLSFIDPDGGFDGNPNGDLDGSFNDLNGGGGWSDFNINQRAFYYGQGGLGAGYSNWTDYQITGLRYKQDEYRGFEVKNNVELRFRDGILGYWEKIRRKGKNKWSAKGGLDPSVKGYGMSISMGGIEAGERFVTANLYDNSDSYLLLWGGLSVKYTEGLLNGIANTLKSGWKQYAQGWWGNEYGTLLYKSGTTPNAITKALSYAKAAKFIYRFGGPVLAAVNFKLLSNDFEAGKISQYDYNRERIATGISAIPIVGTSFGIGWEIGRVLTYGTKAVYRYATTKEYKFDQGHSGSCEVCPYFKK